MNHELFLCVLQSFEPSEFRQFDVTVIQNAISAQSIQQTLMIC